MANWSMTQNGRVLHATLAEKLLTLLLAKLVNFVPEGGIWMNTQRPEWNDANNALVGKGLSVVTLMLFAALHCILQGIVEAEATLSQFKSARKFRNFYSQIFQILNQFQSMLSSLLQRRAKTRHDGCAGSGRQ